MINKFNVKKLFPSFYFDEDVSVVVARIIRAHGFNVVCASEVQLRSKNDEEQIKFAAKEKRIFVTHNIKDFIKLHNEFLNKKLCHSGIILAVRRKDNYEFARWLLNLLNQLEIGGLDNQIRFI